MEEWKCLTEEGLEHYKVSNTGRVILMAREVPTRVKHGNVDMITIAHRKEREISIQYDGGRPHVKLTRTDGSMRKMSVPYLVLKMFGEPCPGPVDKYTAAYLDGDVTNNKVENLIWVSKATLASEIGRSTIGEPKDHFKKYHNLVFYFGPYVLAYFKDTTDALNGLNSMGFNTSEIVLTRALNRSENNWFDIFKVITVDDDTYLKIQLENEIQNLKVIYDIVMLDRKISRRERTSVEKQIVYRDKIKIKKEIVYKDRIVYKTKKDEKPKKEKKVLVNDSTTNGKTEKNKVIKTAEQSKSKLDDIDDKAFYDEQEQIKRDKFKEEMLRLLNNS